MKFQPDSDGKPQPNFIDDGTGKPVGIRAQPNPCYRNSDGDQQMLEYTAGGEGARLALIVHHTDAEHEWANDQTPHIGKLHKAWDDAEAKAGSWST